MSPALCSRCGAEHFAGDPPLSYVIRVPDACFAIPADEREARIMLGDETCSIDDRQFFLRGNLELPLSGPGRAGGDTFVWTVWVALERRDFKRALARWMRADRVKEPPYAVALATDLPCYPRTLGLRGALHTGMVGIRPSIVLAESDHPLAWAQRQGIDMIEVQRIAEMLIHG